MDKMRGMMDDMLRVVDAIQRKARDDSIDGQDSVHSGIQGCAFKDLSTYVATQVKDTVYLIIVSQNACNVVRDSRNDQPLSKFVRARFDPIPGR